MRAPLEGVQGVLVDAFQRAADIPGDAEIERVVGAHVTGNDRLSPAEQVDIYRRQFWLRHVDSLLEDHPGLRAVLGEDDNDAFLRAYLAAFPPKTPSLRDLGKDLARFADTYAFPEAKAELAREMIRYELAFVDVFDGKEPDKLDPAKLASVPEDAWDRARIVVNPLAVRMRFTHPVHEIRLAAKEDRSFDDLVRQRGDYPVVLFRDELMIRFEVLEPDAFLLLEALARGESLVSACDALAEGRSEAEQEALSSKVGGWFQAWTAWRWIVDVELA